MFARALTSFCFLILCSLGALAQDRAPPASGAGWQPAVVRAAFGTIEASAAGELRFLESRRVPLQVDQQYGWIIELRDPPERLRWVEEFTLPAAPQTWGADASVDKRQLSADSRVSTTEREVKPENGFIFNVWSVAPGDPPGQHRIRVFISGVEAASFEFEVR